MKVHVVLLLVDGLPQEPEVFADIGAAWCRYTALLSEYGLNPEDPHDDDHDLYVWEGLVADEGDARGPGMVPRGQIGDFVRSPRSQRRAPPARRDSAGAPRAHLA